jgi:hypothetical protein
MMKTPNYVKILIWSAICAPLVATIAQAQEGERCTLQQISDALNELPCEVDGAFVSAESIVANISTLCDYTLTAEECHNCFEKSGRKALPAFKTLVRLRMLPPTSFPDFLGRLVEAEAVTCAEKMPEGPDWGDGDGPPEDGPPADEAPDLGKGKKRGGDVSRGDSGRSRGGQKNNNSRGRGKSSSGRGNSRGR